MTREEREDAIDIIQLILDKYEEDECLVTEITIGDEGIKALKMAIKALEQEPCKDCISRAELLKAIDTWDKFGCDADTKLVPYKDHYIPYIHYDDVIKCIKGMPSVKQESKTEWIPVSQKLPEEKEHYLTTTMYHEVYCDYWNGERFERTEAVIAWQPLPKPYREVRNDRNNQKRT